MQGYLVNCDILFTFKLRLLNVSGFAQIAGTTLVAPRTSEFIAADALTVPVPLVGTLSETLCGSSRPTGVVQIASSQRPRVSQENYVRSVPISTEVVSLAEHWGASSHSVGGGFTTGAWVGCLYLCLKTSLSLCRLEEDQLWIARDVKRHQTANLKVFVGMLLSLCLEDSSHGNMEENIRLFDDCRNTIVSLCIKKAPNKMIRALENY